jgi:putative oxidoreductase
LPYPEGIAAFALTSEVLGGVAIAVGLWPRLTAAGLIAFTIVAAFISHRFWELSDLARYNQEIHFLKNVALAGGLLFYVVSGPGKYAPWSTNEPPG